MKNWIREHLEKVYRPNIYLAGDVARINFNLLSNWGFRNIILDADNTIVSRSDWEVEERIQEVILDAQYFGFVENICILSNTITKSGNREIRVRRIASQINTSLVICADYSDMKPKPGPFLKAMELMGSTLSNTVVIGDQLMTDIKGGKRVGAFTILVRPLGSDNKVTKANRVVKKIILHRLGLEPVPFPEHRPLCLKK